MTAEPAANSLKRPAKRPTFREKLPGAPCAEQLGETTFALRRQPGIAGGRLKLQRWSQAK